MSTNELTEKIRTLRELQALIEEAQAEAEGIKDAIKAHMGASEELRAGACNFRFESAYGTDYRSKARGYESPHNHPEEVKDIVPRPPPEMQDRGREKREVSNAEAGQCPVSSHLCHPPDRCGSGMYGIWNQSDGGVRRGPLRGKQLPVVAQP